MSEVESQNPPAPVEKSEDKLEIEKEEKEEKEKAEEIVGEMFSDEKKEESKGEEKQVAGDETSEKQEEKVEEPQKKDGAEKTDDAEKKEDEKTEVKEKKFNMPKIKAPKIINEIRSRSKSREKKKNKDKEGGEEEGDPKPEGAEGTSTEGEEKKEEQTEEKKDLVKEAKTKVKDAMDNIKLPHIKKPGFMKKKTKEGDKTEETKEGEEEEKKEGEPDVKKEEEEKDAEKTEEDAEKPEDKKDSEKTEEKKTSIIDSLKNIKSQVFNKGKKAEETTETDGEKPEEAEKLLEEKPKEEENEEEVKEKSKGSSLLKSIRNVASGVPALFKKDSPKEADAEAGEKEDLLEKKEGEENKTDDLKMEEIKLEDDKKDGEKDDEKKDPEKGDGEVQEEKSPLDRLKRLPSEALRQVNSLDKQRQYGLLGIVVGLLLLILIIIIASCFPGGWSNHHKLVEDGKYVETLTSCGTVRGLVEGPDRFMFKSIPYSVSVERFSHSRLPQTLDECGDEVKQPSNKTTICKRRLASGIIGDEDCLTVDIATSSVVYSSPAPVVAYIGGDDPSLAPASDLAYVHGVVFVNIQVRQGILGYLSHPLLSNAEMPPTSGNYALGDLITALKWIRLNIRHFGGDPDQVTILGHKQGASLATALTAVMDARNLYHRVWVTGGSGNLETVSLDDAGAQYDDVVRQVCGGNRNKECLLDADVDNLLEAVPKDSEPWSYDDLPTRGDNEMPSYIVRDSIMIKEDSFGELLRETPLTVPIVFGVTAQSEANSANYKLYDWNNTDSVDSAIENNLGSFDVSLSSAAMKLYNESCNWSKYISIVSDIRTLCPINNLATNFTKLYSDSFVSFYVAKEDNPADSNGSGHVADSTTDIAAIFDMFPDHSFGTNLRRKFYQFVKGYIQKLTPEVVVFDKSNSKFSDEKCRLWQNGTNSLVPKYGRKF